MKKRLTTLMQIVPCMVLPSVAKADVLVELFTSQACSVCETSINLLSELEKQEDVATLSFHVDYWDYLGEDDRFASPLFGARQIGYIREDEGKKEVHTPELVVAGSTGYSASEPEKIHADIDNALASELEIIEIHNDQAEVVVVLKPEQGLEQDYNVVLAELFTSKEVEELRNDQTETLATRSLVKEIGALGRWDNESEQSFAFQPEAGRSYVVFLQAAGFGEIIDSKRINIPEKN